MRWWNIGLSHEKRFNQVSDYERVFILELACCCFEMLVANAA